MYSATIGFLIRNREDQERATKAIAFAKSLTDLLHEPCGDWLGEALIIANETNLDEDAFTGANPILGSKSINVTHNMGWLKHAFILSFYFLKMYEKCPADKVAEFYAMAIRQTVELGGDTDTNACIVGGLIGALVGA